jgi:hypothetical protein
MFVLQYASKNVMKKTSYLQHQTKKIKEYNLLNSRTAHAQLADPRLINAVLNHSVSDVGSTSAFRCWEAALLGPWSS